MNFNQKFMLYSQLSKAKKISRKIFRTQRKALEIETIFNIVISIDVEHNGKVTHKTFSSTQFIENYGSGEVSSFYQIIQINGR